MRYRFGSFELDTKAYRLTRAGQERKLQPKVFDVLAYLVEHRGEVVTKQDLLDALWPGEHVGDATVTWSVSFARRALDQARSDKQPIETVHGRGYRFVADVQALTAAPSSPPPAPGQLAPQAPSSAPAAASATALPFVGREAVMQRLRVQLAEAEQGRGRATVLAGEAGIGKTRCAEELVHVAEARGLTACVGRAVELGGAPVLYPWRQVLRELGQRRPALRARVDELLAQLRSYEGATPSAQPTSERFALFEAIAELLRQAAAHAPLVLVLDDLHWADASTIEALAFVARELSSSRVLVLTTQRDEPEEHNRRALARLSRVAERLSLAHLSDDDVRAYFAHSAPHAAPSEALCTAVQRATAGNALFVQELVRGLLEAHGDGGLSRLDPTAIKPPPVARDVLRAPLAALDPRALELLSAASVVGDAFDLSLVQHLCQLDVDVLLDRLEDAVRRELIVAEAPHRYRFRHVLLRAILYDDLPASRRLALHRRAAEWLAAQADRGAPAGEIALHYYRSLAAGDPERVASAALHAARAAERLYAFEDAAVFYEWALEAQSLDAAATPRARAELLLACGAAQRTAGRVEHARSTLARMIDLAREHAFGDLLVRAARTLRPIYVLGTLPDRLVRSALESALRVLPDAPSPERVRALSQLACVPPIAHDLPRSKALCEEALALAFALGEGGTTSVLEAHRARLYALSGPSDLDALLGVCDEVLALDAERTWLSAEAYSARLATHATRGDLAAAEAARAGLSRVSEALRHSEGLWYAARVRAQRLFEVGDFDAAASAYDALLARAKHVGLSYGPAFIELQQLLLWRERVGVKAFAAQLEPRLLEPALPAQHSGTAFRARMLLELGNLDAARRLLDSLTAQDFRDVPQESSYLSTLAHAAAVAVGLRDRARAERLRELLAPYSELHVLDLMLACHGPVALYLAELQALLAPDDASTGALYERAIAGSDAMGHRPLVARATYAHARYLAAQRTAASRERSRELLQRARALAEALDMRWLAMGAVRDLESRAS